MTRRPPNSTLFPNPPLFRFEGGRPYPPDPAPKSYSTTSTWGGVTSPPTASKSAGSVPRRGGGSYSKNAGARRFCLTVWRCVALAKRVSAAARSRSEEHTSELQSRLHLVCRLLLEKKKKHADVIEIPSA